MKIAILLRGITYIENYTHGNNTYSIDFHDTYKSFIDKIINPYIELGYDIDIFIITYDSKYKDDILNIYKPVKYIFNDFNTTNGRLPGDIGARILLHQWKNGINLIETYELESNIQYDFYIITRPDLYFYEKITDINIDYMCVNLLFFHMNGHIFSSEDNWIGFPNSKKNIIKESIILQDEINNTDTTHAIGRHLINKGETINYLYGEKGDGAYDYPFYKFGRHIFGNPKEINIEDIPNIKMNRVNRIPTDGKNNIYINSNSPLNFSR